MRKPLYYILDEHDQLVGVNDVSVWGRWFETATRRVALTRFCGQEVSTVFLGLDHSFGEGPPVLWETMIFRGRRDGDGDRCSGNREQAEAMHAGIVRSFTTGPHLGGDWFSAQSRKRRRKMFRQEKRKL